MNLDRISEYLSIIFEYLRRISEYLSIISYQVAEGTGAGTGTILKTQK